MHEFDWTITCDLSIKPLVCLSIGYIKVATIGPLLLNLKALKTNVNTNFGNLHVNLFKLRFNFINSCKPSMLYISGSSKPNINSNIIKGKENQQQSSWLSSCGII